MPHGGFGASGSLLANSELVKALRVGGRPGRGLTGLLPALPWSKA